MFARVHQAADWEHGRDMVQRALGIDHVKELYDGPLERCDGLVKKVADISREIITSESLLANVGGEVTELLELPAEIMLALRTVHRVAGCYGYALDHPEDETLVMAIIGLSLLDDPGERLSASRLIRGLEDGTLTRDDEQRLSTIAETRLKDEVGDDLAREIGATLVEEKVEEGIPFLGAALGVVLDNAFIQGVEKAARFTFQERWLREHGKVDEIAPAVASQRRQCPDRRGLEPGRLLDQLCRQLRRRLSCRPARQCPLHRAPHGGDRRNQRRGHRRDPRRRSADRRRPRSA